jgi:hypothetical protein
MPAMPLNLDAFLSKGWCFNFQLGTGAPPSTQENQNPILLKPGGKRFPHQC